MIISYDAWAAVRDERKLGYVAEFCPVCRQIRSCSLLRVGEKFRVDPIDGAPRIANVVRCGHCPFTMPVDALKYASMTESSPANLEALIEQTHPHIRAELAERLALEKQLDMGATGLSAAQRQAMLSETFQCLAGPMEVLFRRNKKIDRQTLATGLISVVLTVLSMSGCVMYSKGRKDDDKWLATVAIVLVIGGLFTLVQHALGTKRRVRKEFIPALANGLRPLKPTREELQNYLQGLKAERWRLGSEIKTDALWAATQLA